tara:strand:- start:347 stop:1672 length:1326 start_codon:yes stop_codon:yes gene_type:complete
MFSKQSYSGQGMVQPMVTSQAGQNLARGIEQFGEGIGQAFKSAGESKKLRSKLAPFADEFMPDNIKGTPQEKEFTKMFETRLDDMGLKELEGMSENLLLKKSLQMYDAKIKQANMQNQVTQRGISQGIAQDAFDVNLLSGQPPHQAALNAFQSTDAVPPGAAKVAMDRKQATAFAQGVEQDFPAGADMATMQAIVETKRNEQKDALAQSSFDSMDAYRKKNMEYLQAQSDALNNKHQLETQAAARRGGLTEEQAKTSMDLFKTLNASEPVKLFKQLQSQYSNLENVIFNIDKLEGAGDIAAVFTFMKSLDPESVVREGEFKAAAGAGGLMAAFVNQANKALTGEFLTNDTRFKLLQTAREAAKSYVDSANMERSRIVEYGKGFEIPEKYSGGSEFSLKATKTFATSDEAREARDRGEVRPGEKVRIMTNGELKEYTLGKPN